MRWYRELYIGETLRYDAAVVQAKIRRFVSEEQIFLICLSTNGTDLFDITPTASLLQPGAKKHTWDIIGIARGKEEAVNLTAAIVEEVWKRTGTFDVRTFVEDQMVED